MLKLIWLLSATLVLGSGALWGARPGDAVDLGKYRWKNRLLFIFSPFSEDPAFQALSTEVNRNSEGIRDRDVVVFRILDSGPGYVDSQEISPQAAKAFRERFGVGRGRFTVVLVGKDGGVKLQRSGPVALSDIFELIDTMPMRQGEMQRR